MVRKSLDLEPPQLPDLVEIRILREKLGWTQRKLGQRCGLSQSYINKIERNESNPSYKTVKRIFEVLTDGSKRRGEDSKTAGDIMVGYLQYVSTTDTIEYARRLMAKNDYSQLPVIDSGILKGSITDKIILAIDERGLKVGDVMGKKFPLVDIDTSLGTVRHILEDYSAVLVDRGSRQYGIITKQNLLRASRY